MRGLVREVIVVNGGSSDTTCAIAEETGARLIEAQAGRGGQLAAGAEAARSDWLLFLHGDTTLDESWGDEVHTFIGSVGRTAMKAAAFKFTLDDYSRTARLLEYVVHIRCKLLALPYGDQALLISRHFYQNIGGFRAMPLMEDVDIVRRIGRKRLVFLKSKAITSASRYKRQGYFLQPLRNFMILTLYLIGVPPRVLVRFYG